MQRQALFLLSSLFFQDTDFFPGAENSLKFFPFQPLFNNNYLKLFRLKFKTVLFQTAGIT